MKKRNKWGRKPKNNIKVKYWKAIFQLRDEWSVACGIPKDYLLGTDLSMKSETIEQINKVNKILTSFFDRVTKGMSRKSKKKFRNTYKHLRK